MARGAPKVAGIVAGGGAGVRATRSRSIRVLSARPLSGLSRPVEDSSASRPLSALAPSCGYIFQQQQRRLLSIQSYDTPEGVSPPAEAPVAGEDAEAAEELAAAPEVIFHVQVDGLPFSMGTEELTQFFVDGGCRPTEVTLPLWPETSPRVGHNKGRAFLSFANEEDTQKALSMTGQPVMERWLMVTRLAEAVDEARTVTIKGLQGFPDTDVQTLFTEYVGSAPVEVKVVESANQTRGLAFVTFETAEQARVAMRLDGSQIHRRWVDVSLHVKKSVSPVIHPDTSEDPFGPDVPHELVVYIRNLAFDLPDSEIMQLLLDANIDEDDIVAIKVPKFNASPFNRGVAMVHMKSEKAVSQAVELRGTIVRERWLNVLPWADRDKVQQRTPFKEKAKETNSQIQASLREKHPAHPVVTIMGLPFHKTEGELIEFLEENGVPRSAMVEVKMPLFLQTKNNTGACWVVIDDETAYDKLLDLNGAIIDDRWISVFDT